MTTTVPRWCVNCKHAAYEHLTRLTVCKHPTANQAYIAHLVDGDYRLASSARNDETSCGLEGRLWEAKATQTSMMPRTPNDFKRRGFWRFLPQWRSKT